MMQHRPRRGNFRLQTAIFETHVDGMTCRPCEDTILDALLSTRGIVRAEVSYWKASVRVEYDPELLSEKQIGELLSVAGYPPCATSRGGWKTELLTAIAVPILCLVLPHIPLLSIPQVQGDANLPMLFLIGLVTGTHCICMCGGITLSQTTSSDLRMAYAPAKPFFRYQVGRLLASTVLGIAFGALGTVLSYSIKLKSMLYTLCGLAVLFIGLCTWGTFPMLRRVQAQLPALCRMPSGIKRIGKPFVVGILNALLPCAASSTMWLYAASTGSPFAGGLSMLVWCLGTFPAMGIFAGIGKILPPKGQCIFERLSVVLMLAMGVNMAVRGLNLIL